jgi:replicative DNA helicase
LRVTASNFQFDSRLPSNVEAEKTILGAILLDNAAWEEVRAGLKSDDFSLDSHKRIVKVIAALMKNGHAVDIVTLAAELDARKERDAIGGIAYLASLTEGLPRRPVISEYIRIVRDKSVLCKLMNTCSQAISRAAEQSESGLVVIADLMSQLEKLTTPSQSANTAPVQNFIVSVADEVVRDYQQKTTLYIPSGNSWFDAKTGGGYRCGKITIVAARPKVGKSSWGITSTAFNCMRGTRVVWFSLEMDKKELSLNLVPYVVDLPNIVATRPTVRTPEQQALVMQGLGTLADWPWTVHDQDMDCDEVCWIIDRETRDPSPVLFVLDHFGKLKGAGKVLRERYVENSDRIMKKMRHKNAAMLNLMQLKPVPREFADKRPQSEDVKESGNPIEDCFACVLLHRYQDKETLKMTKKANINLALIRGGGSSGNVDGEFNPRKLCFEAEAELDYSDGSYFE